MKPALPGDRSTAILLKLCGVLTLTILVEINLPERAGITVDFPGETTDTEIPSTATAEWVPRPLADYGEILDRPLLFEGRKMPPEPEQATAAAIPRAPLRLELEGVAISSDNRAALLRNMADNQLLQLSEGMSHDGWTLETLNSSAATFRRGDELAELALETEPTQRRRR